MNAQMERQFADQAARAADRKARRSAAAKKAWETMRARKSTPQRKTSSAPSPVPVRDRKAEKIARAFGVALDTASQWSEKLRGWMPFDDSGLQAGRFLFCWNPILGRSAWVDCQRVEVLTEQRLDRLLAT